MATATAGQTNANSCETSSGPGYFSCDASVSGGPGTTGTLSNGVEYSYDNILTIGGSNATGNAPLISSTFYYGKPSSGSFSYPGTAIASVQFVLTDMPAMLTATNVSTSLGFDGDAVGSFEPVLSAGESFTCTLYDNGVSLGSASANANDETGSSGGTSSTSSSAICESSYPAITASTSYTALVNVANGSYNAGDTYTWIISH
jgi:hypothetical protein